MRTVRECFVEAHLRKGYSRDEINTALAYADLTNPFAKPDAMVVEDESLIQAMVSAIDIPSAIQAVHKELGKTYTQN